MDKELYVKITPDPHGEATHLICRIEDLAEFLGNGSDYGVAGGKDRKYKIEVLVKTNAWYEKLPELD